MARFAANGQVCEMTLEKREKTDTGIAFDVSFSEKEVQTLIDDLVPENQRGRNLTRTLNETIDGAFTTTEYTYENAVVRVYGLVRPVDRQKSDNHHLAEKALRRSGGDSALVIYEDEFNGDVSPNMLQRGIGTVPIVLTRCRVIRISSIRVQGRFLV